MDLDMVVALDHIRDKMVGLCVPCLIKESDAESASLAHNN